MSYNIRKAAVIGSGTMGGGIAALLAGVGVDTMLLDIPARDTTPGDPPNKRNAIVINNLKTLQKMRPPQLLQASSIDRISIGNIDDDLDKLSDADWIIEVVVERLDIKQSLMARVAEVAKPNAIISSNTSGLPIHNIADGLGEDFSRRFMGTHFFNPPRYLHLLEVIPHSNTDSEAVAFIKRFGTERLGKGVVLCKDTPNFIGNRFMSMSGMQAMNYALDNGYTVEEVDALTGPLIGRPKTATFNLNDLVGFDVAVHVARNLYDAVTDDPQREVLNHPGASELSNFMLENNLLGRKTDRGFYHMRRENGKKELWALNLSTREYEPPQQVNFESINKHRRVKPLGERLRLLINEEDRGGRYLYHLHAFYLAYASNRVPEITDSIVNVDNAQKWGFNHEMGPFEIWDAIGVADTIDRFETDGYPVAEWVKEMVQSGRSTFYRRNADGVVNGYYSPQKKDYVAVENDPRVIEIATLRASGARVGGNDDGSIYDIGDGVLLWEFTTKQNSITPGLVQSGWEALKLLEDEKYVALVVGNDAERFSIGANLDPSALMEGLEGIEKVLVALQDLTQALRYAPKPVVTAAHSMALGGGCELMMSGTATAAHVELYCGLVEVGVGLVPAGGGCKELVRRVISPLVADNANNDVLPLLQDIFQALATARVSGSAFEAKEIGYLAETDRVVMNRRYLLGEAKTLALSLANGYTPRAPEKVWASGRDAYAALLIAIESFREGGYATEYDAVIAEKLAYILTGGALSEPQWVDQQVLLNLERKAFLDLIMQEKTMERVMHMLQTNKPLRN
jgi:3-hydroxyacyl-CoA dehydrogenase